MRGRGEAVASLDYSYRGPLPFWRREWLLHVVRTDLLPPFTNPTGNRMRNQSCCQTGWRSGRACPEAAGWPAAVPSLSSQPSQTSPARHLAAAHTSTRCYRRKGKAEKASLHVLAAREQNAKCDPHGPREAGSDGDKRSSLISHLCVLSTATQLWLTSRPRPPPPCLTCSRGACHRFCKHLVEKARCTPRSQLSDLPVV